jgi:hypothetical protein
MSEQVMSFWNVSSLAHEPNSLTRSLMSGLCSDVVAGTCAAPVAAKRHCSCANLPEVEFYDAQDHPQLIPALLQGTQCTAMAKCTILN